MKWNIVADSSCDLRSTDVACPETGFATVPFVFNIDGIDYTDTEDMNIETMLAAMDASDEASRSACPSPADWADEFEKAENTIAITISSNLSGSYNSALAARDLVLADDPSKNIVILDSKSTGPETALTIRHMVELIKAGHPIEKVRAEAQRFLDEMRTVFALSSFDNLVKNGRMSRFTGFVARKLGMWGIGIASDEGTIIIKGKSRGPQKALAFILDDMIERGFTGGVAAISHCMNPEMAKKLKDAILERWHEAKITILETRGLDSYYAERGGLIVAF